MAALGNALDAQNLLDAAGLGLRVWGLGFRVHEGTKSSRTHTCRCLEGNKGTYYLHNPFVIYSFTPYEPPVNIESLSTNPRGALPFHAPVSFSFDPPL